MTALLLINANSLHIPLASGSVHCVITSSPYWGLRFYHGTARWIGGDPACNHSPERENGKSTSTLTGGQASNNHAQEPYSDYCRRCGAIREDQQLGLEASPEEFVANMVEVFREVKRVLRDDGTLWLNLGDSYATQAGKGANIPQTKWQANTYPESAPHRSRSFDGLKPKDLVGIPWMVAFALRSDGWYLRSDIVWNKPNPMPESVTDRPTKSHEYLFLLAKSERYFYDQAAVLEPVSPNTHLRVSQDVADQVGSWRANGGAKTNGPMKAVVRTPKQAEPGQGIKNNTSFNDAVCLPVLERNKRSVWTITTQPYSGAHFATFPPALVEPCIKAGTSERGCCPKCGAPWTRVTERGFTSHEADTESAYDKKSTAGRLALLRQAARKNGGEYTNSKRLLGWQPACACDAGDPVPCLVLDPFAGSGTTLMVARSLGRDAVGLDLSYAYLHDQARSRLQLDALDAWTNGRKPEQATADLGPLFGELS